MSSDFGFNSISLNYHHSLAAALFAASNGGYFLKISLRICARKFRAPEERHWLLIIEISVRDRGPYVVVIVIQRISTKPSSLFSVHPGLTPAFDRSLSVRPSQFGGTRSDGWRMFWCFCHEELELCVCVFHSASFLAD